MASRIGPTLPVFANQFKAELAELKRRKFLKRKRPLSRQSRLRAVAAQVYRHKRVKFLIGHPLCEYPHCCTKSEDVHHSEGRSGKNYLDVSTWIALCRKHHDFVHRHPNKAREMGLLR